MSSSSYFYLNNWDAKHFKQWTKRGETCGVKITQHQSAPEGYGDVMLDTGPWRWGVYGYVYPKHPLFNEIQGHSPFQSALEKAPLHYGCTWLKRHYGRNDDTITAIEFGCHYNHNGDFHYTMIADEFDAKEIFIDAEKLLKWLSWMAEETAIAKAEGRS